jgi:hypothetical protein
VKPPAATSAKAFAPTRGDGDIVALCRRQVEELPQFSAGDEGDLLRDVAARAGARIDPLSECVARVTKHVSKLATLAASWNHLAATMKEHIDTVAQRTVAQQLMELELSIALLECWTRVAELDLALAGLA